jgi:Fur family iron response transcriptional regulator
MTSICDNNAEDQRIIACLEDAGVRPTRQRVLIGRLLLDGRKRHVGAEQLYEEVQSSGHHMALATVYNCLHKFAGAGLLRQVKNIGDSVLFDTNLSEHYHFVDIETGAMVDIHPADVTLKKMPTIPEGFEAESIELTVRLRRKVTS